jgi:hypothetical protein
MKLPMGRLGSCSPARLRRMAFGHRAHRLFLADHAACRCDPSIVSSFSTLALQQLGDRDARPLATMCGDLLGIDLFLEQRAVLAAWRTRSSALACCASRWRSLP